MMTQVSLTQSFKETSLRFAEVVRLARPNMVTVRDYADTAKLNMPYAEIVFPSLNLTVTDPAKQEIELLPEVRMFCGQATDGYDGLLQQRITFEWLPSMTQKFIEYSNLCYPGKNTPIPWLDTQRTGLTRAQIILDGQAKLWLMVFYWRIVFRPVFKKVIGR